MRAGTRSASVHRRSRCSTPCTRRGASAAGRPAHPFRSDSAPHRSRWTKSEEEIAFLRKGTEIAELTLGAIRSTAREGVPERDVFAQMMYVNAKAGGSFTPMFGWITGPQGRPMNFQ